MRPRNELSSDSDESFGASLINGLYFTDYRA